MTNIPMNTDGGIAKTLLAGYFKYGVATLLSGNYGSTGTYVKIIYDRDSSTTKAED